MNKENALFTVFEVLQNQKRKMHARDQLQLQLRFAPLSKRFQNASTIPRKNLRSTNGFLLTNKQANTVKKLAYRNYHTSVKQGLPVKRLNNNNRANNVPLTGYILGANGIPLTNAQIRDKKIKENKKENNEVRRLLNLILVNI